MGNLEVYKNTECTLQYLDETNTNLNVKNIIFHKYAQR